MPANGSVGGIRYAVAGAFLQPRAWLDLAGQAHRFISRRRSTLLDRQIFHDGNGVHAGRKGHMYPKA